MRTKLAVVVLGVWGSALAGTSLGCWQWILMTSCAKVGRPPNGSGCNYRYITNPWCPSMPAAQPGQQGYLDPSPVTYALCTGYSQTSNLFGNCVDDTYFSQTVPCRTPDGPACIAPGGGGGT